MLQLRHAAFAAAIAVSPLISSAAVLFSDNFNNSLASALNFSVVANDPTSSFPTYAYNYAAMGIPSAPNSGDASTLGLRLDANFSAPNAPEGITLHTIPTFSGDYSVKFDAWLNVNGPFPAGGSGSTNYFTAGVGGDNLANNFVGNTGLNAWTAVNGDNGSGVDYRLYKGSILQGPASAQYAAGTAADARNGLNAYYSAFGNINVSTLPVQGANNGGPVQQTGTSFPGSFGMAWHQVELRVDADGGTGGAPSVKWFVDNLLIGTLDAGNGDSFVSNGAVTLGYSDPTANSSDLPTHSFALIDNLRVTDVPEPAALSLAGLALAAIARRRRRRA